MRSTYSADYVMLLNPDTIPRGGAISALVDYMEAHQCLGIAGSRLDNGKEGVVLIFQQRED